MGIMAIFKESIANWESCVKIYKNPENGFHSRGVRTGPIPFRRCVSTSSASASVASSSAPSTTTTTAIASVARRRVVIAIHHPIWGPSVRRCAFKLPRTKIPIASFRVSGGTIQIRVCTGQLLNQLFVAEIGVRQVYLKIPTQRDRRDWEDFLRHLPFVLHLDLVCQSWRKKNS